MAADDHQRDHDGAGVPVNLYHVYRGHVDPTAVYRAWKGDREIRYTLDPGDDCDLKGIRLFREKYGEMPTGTERVYDGAET